MVNALEIKINGVTFLFIIFLTSKDHKDLRSDHRYSHVEELLTTFVAICEKPHSVVIKHLNLRLLNSTSQKRLFQKPRGLWNPCKKYRPVLLLHHPLANRPESPDSE